MSQGVGHSLKISLFEPRVRNLLQTPGAWQPKQQKRVSSVLWRLRSQVPGHGAHGLVSLGAPLD